MKLKFTKMHGAGNDFVVIEANDMDLEWSELAISLCNRHFGIGADGLLLITPSANADIRMRIFNADGSEAATCGNGIRCVVKYYIESGKHKANNELVLVETRSGIRKAWGSRIAGEVNSVKVSMGKPEVRQKKCITIGENERQLDIKKSNDGTVCDGNLDVEFVDLGNQHAVYFTEIPVHDFPLSQIGPLVENEFSDGINFEIARVIEGNRIEARVWEHGVGETLACGSGACAIGVAAFLRGYSSRLVEVELPGGTLKVNSEDNGEVYLTGPVEKLFDGEWLRTGKNEQNQARPALDKNEVFA